MEVHSMEMCLCGIRTIPRIVNQRLQSSCELGSKHPSARINLLQTSSKRRKTNKDSVQLALFAWKLSGNCNHPYKFSSSWVSSTTDTFQIG